MKLSPIFLQLETGLSCFSVVAFSVDLCSSSHKLFHVLFAYFYDFFLNMSFLRAGTMSNSSLGTVPDTLSGKQNPGQAK